MFNFFNEIKSNLKTQIDGFNIVNISGVILYVEGHLGLLTLSRQSISFKVKGGAFLVEGDDMILAELNENTIKISGKIKKVEQL